MSTHRLISERRRVFGLPAFSVLAGLLLALQLWLPTSALASPLQDAPVPAQNLARAGVSVVRLLVYYATNKTADANATKPTAVCNGLGVLFSSKPRSDTSKYENWVLTDGTLVNSENQATCLDGNPAATLIRIDVYASSAYSPQPFLLSSVLKPADNKPLAVTCRQRPAKCTDGPALFSFLSDAPQPFLDLVPSLSSTPVSAAATGGAASPEQALQLTDANDASGILSPSSQDAAHFDDYSRQAQGFLQPNLTASTNTRSFESGTPIIDSVGALSGLYLLNAPLINASDIQLFVKTMMPDALGASNPVHDNWNNGMDAYYKLHTPANAASAFNKALVANPRFEAATRFASLSQQPATTAPQAKKADVPADPLSSLLNRTFQIAGFTIYYWQAAALAVFIVLLLIILLVIFLAGAARRRRKRILAAELADAERRATIEARQIAEMEAKQHGKALQSANGINAASAMHGQPEVPVQYSPVNQQALVGDQLSFPEAKAGLCPRCGEPVALDANFCSNCRLQFSSSDSGPHVRLASPPVPPVVKTPSAPPLASTQELKQPNGASGLPLAEQPTVDMATTSHAGSGDLEKTVPYTVRHLNGQHLGFAVGTRSDPGIKRKYKPNEDSLFAAQGVISLSSPQLFGLFIVADGMGGHANGEDASRLAIQTIADYMLPRLTKNTALQSEQYAQLLVEGIQKANLAVHQNNVQQHGDMGTTVTATLLVDTVAYVANVGDSRTYLYRPSQGLKKVTVDHSVVASLVEAGIIKPDDIYTHPKRNQIYRSLGEKAAVEVDSFTVQLQAGDKLLLCSDGLWDMVRDPQIEEVIKNPDPDPSITGDALIHSALEGGGEDNVSVIVVHITDGMKSGAMPRFQLLTKPDSVQMPQL